MDINDLPILGPFAVFDKNSDHVIFRSACHDEPGDIPPDIAVLPVLGIYAVDDLVYIDTEVE